MNYLFFLFLQARRGIGGEEKYQTVIMPMSMSPLFPLPMIGRTIRWFSWVRFLSLTHDNKSGNIILLRHNPPTFQTTQQINSGQIIRLYVDRVLSGSSSINNNHKSILDTPTTTPQAFSFLITSTNKNYTKDSLTHTYPLLHKTIEVILGINKL
jgi:hypothetical protein